MGDGALWFILTKAGARLWRTREVGTFEEVAIEASQDRDP
jgi:hypothetical protein